MSRLLVSVLIIQLMRAGLKASHLGLLALSRFRDRFPVVEERTIPLFDLVMTVGIVGAAAYALLQVWNIDPTAWLASAGIIGIAVGFAAKDTLANLFAGFFIIADAPYKLGDYVVLDSGERGEVTRVGSAPPACSPGTTWRSSSPTRSWPTPRSSTSPGDAGSSSAYG